MTEGEALDGVRAVVRNIVSDPTIQLGPDVRLIADLGLSSDDLSFLFVPNIERQFGIKPSLEIWRGVFTIGDVVQLVLAETADLTQRRRNQAERPGSSG